MSQDFQPHPVLVNYEASHDGVVRNRRLKKPVGVVSNTGYLRFTVGKKRYHNHRIVIECFYGLIKDGFVIDHKNGIKTDNSLSNLRVVTQSENTQMGKTGKHAKQPMNVKSFDLETNEQKIFQSMNEASRYFDICMPSVRFVAENITKTARSMRTGHRIQFSYIKGDNSYSNKVA